ncbi:helix-turn-helix domain-containing protein [Massiliimalia massiliensis]|uniref:helix-turn-helix domain-containing protein n=1 Tax=Massiliimalia massiliensis TaxID=1852384 RepID=UPI0009875973|nr:helix-turn-helix transcriptional regulator [Massiliimalia massiliensis]
MEISVRDRLVLVGLNIAFYRKKKGMTQEQLAEIVGTSRTHISNIEATKIDKTPSLELLLKIADALDVEAEKLLHFR